MSNIFYKLVFHGGQEITYEMLDTPLAKKWLDLVIAGLNGGQVYPTGWWAHPDFDEKYLEKVWLRMVDAVNEWNHGEIFQLVPDQQKDHPDYKIGDYKNWKFFKQINREVPWEVPEKYHITMSHHVPKYSNKKELEEFHNILNKLHERFHWINEDMDAYPPGKKILLRSGSPLTRLNIDIHILEHQLAQENKRGAASTNCCFYLGGETKWDRQTVPLTDEDYKQYNYKAQHGDMIPGYHTVGKNLMHCWVDNDIELIKAGMVRPQINLASETIHCFYSIPKFSLSNNAFTRQHKEGNMDGEIEKMWKWVEENNLSEYVDRNNPAHSANYPPAIGKLLNNVTSQEINNIYRYTKLKHIELIDQNTMLRWKSNDYKD